MRDFYGCMFSSATSVEAKSQAARKPQELPDLFLVSLTAAFLDVTQRDHAASRGHANSLLRLSYCVTPLDSEAGAKGKKKRRTIFRLV